MLHVGAQIFRIGNRSKLFFPLPLSSRRLRRITKQGLLIGDDIGSKRRKRYGRKQDSGDDASAIHPSSSHTNSARILPDARLIWEMKEMYSRNDGRGTCNAKLRYRAVTNRPSLIPRSIGQYAEMMQM